MILQVCFTTPRHERPDSGLNNLKSSFAESSSPFFSVQQVAELAEGRMFAEMAVQQISPVGSDRLSPGSTFFAESSSPDTTLLLLHNCPLLLGVSTRTSRRAVGCSAAVLPLVERFDIEPFSDFSAK